MDLLDVLGLFTLLDVVVAAVWVAAIALIVAWVATLLATGVAAAGARLGRLCARAGRLILRPVALRPARRRPLPVRRYRPMPDARVP